MEKGGEILRCAQNDNGLEWPRKGMKMDMGFTPILTFPHQGGREL